MNDEEMKKAQEALALARRIRNDLEIEKGKLESRKRPLNQRLEFLNTSFVPLSDHKQFLKEYIDAQARSYLPSFREMMKGSMQMGTMNSNRGFGHKDCDKPMRYHEMERELSGGGFLTWPLSMVRVDKNNPMDTPFLFFFGEFVKRAIDLHFDELSLEREYKAKPEEVGPPIAERRLEMEAITHELLIIEEEISSINSKLSSLR